MLLHRPHGFGEVRDLALEVGEHPRRVEEGGEFGGEVFGWIVWSHGRTRATAISAGSDPEVTFEIVEAAESRDASILSSTRISPSGAEPMSAVAYSPQPSGILRRWNAKTAGRRDGLPGSRLSRRSSAARGTGERAGSSGRSSSAPPWVWSRRRSIFACWAGRCSTPSSSGWRLD